MKPHISAEQMRRHCRGELAEADSLRIDRLIEAHPELREQYRKMNREVLADSLGAMAAEDVSKVREPAPQRVSWVKEQMRASREAEWWSIRFEEGEHPSALVTGARDVVHGTAHSNQARDRGDVKLRVRLCVEERDPLRLIVACADWPIGQELRAVMLAPDLPQMASAQLDCAVQELAPFVARTDRLAAKGRVEDRQMQLAAKGADDSLSRSSAQTFKHALACADGRFKGSFRAISPGYGQVTASLPLAEDTPAELPTFLVCETQFEALQGDITCTHIIELARALQGRIYGAVDFEHPRMLGSDRVRVTVRALDAEDIQLLSPEQRAKLFSAQPAVSIMARSRTAGVAEIQPRWQHQNSRLADAGVTWALQVVASSSNDVGEEVADVQG